MRNVAPYSSANASSMVSLDGTGSKDSSVMTCLL